MPDEAPATASNVGAIYDTLADKKLVFMLLNQTANCHLFQTRRRDNEL